MQQYLPNLKVLGLSYSENLIRTPDFDGLPCLERIRLDGCPKLTYIDPSISHHERLIYVDMQYCRSLKEFPPISGMKNLETLLLSGCSQICKFPEVQMIMDKLVTLSLSRTGIKVVPSSVRQYCTNLLSFDLRGCESLPSMISSVLCGLSNLQELDLRYNDFSRLDCSLLQLPFLKSLNLSGCHNLVELPDLPASIAILKADGCEKLKIVHLPTKLKWLWRITVPMESILGDVEREVQSILQGDVIKDYSISLCFYSCLMQTRDSTRRTRRTVILELPSYNKFSGFLICIEASMIWVGNNAEITIKDVTDGKNEGVSDSYTTGSFSSIYLYISLGSLRHTSWWKSTTHTTISFSIQGYGYLRKAELVEGGETRERVKDTTNSSEFWDKEPIKIIHDSKSCIKIQPYHIDGDDDDDDDDDIKYLVREM